MVKDARRTMAWWTVITLAVVSAVLVGACAGPEPSALEEPEEEEPATEAPTEEPEPTPEPEPVVVNVSLSEFQIGIDTDEIPLGVPVTFNITNDGVLEHELAVEPWGADDEPLTQPDGAAVEAEEISPGDTVSFTYTFEKDEPLQLACHVPGHYEAGMWTGLVSGVAEIPEEHPLLTASTGEMFGTGECMVRAVPLLGAWVEAGAPEIEGFAFTSEDGAACTGTFEADVQPLFTENGAWFDGSPACVGCHHSDPETAYHEMDLSSYVGIMAGADVFEDPPGEPLLGQSAPGATDFNWEESGLHARLRDNRMPPGWEFDITEENRDGPTLDVNGAEVRAVDLIGAWVDAGAPETEPFGDYEATFAGNILPLFTEEGAWFDESAACTSCHHSDPESAFHELDLSSYAGFLAGADVFEDPPGEPILGQSAPGATDYNWEESGLRARLRDNRMPPGWEFDITEENRDGPTILAGTMD